MIGVKISLSSISKPKFKSLSSIIFLGAVVVFVKNLKFKPSFFSFLIISIDPEISLLSL